MHPLATGLFSDVFIFPVKYFLISLRLSCAISGFPIKLFAIHITINGSFFAGLVGYFQLLCERLSLHPWYFVYA